MAALDVMAIKERDGLPSSNTVFAYVIYEKIKSRHTTVQSIHLSASLTSNYFCRMVIVIAEAPLPP